MTPDHVATFGSSILADRAARPLFTPPPYKPPAMSPAQRLAAAIGFAQSNRHLPRDELAALLQRYDLIFSVPLVANSNKTFEQIAAEYLGVDLLAEA